MTRKQFLSTPLVAAAAASAAARPAAAADWKPKRVNKAIELLEAKQPIYYAGGRGGYEEGKAAAQTHADFLNYEMEHGALDFTALRAFMKGLVDGGPTKSGHRTPAVIATLPVLGIDEMHMRANFWVVQQTLCCGVHGILLCHARDPEAIKWMVRAARYPHAEPRVPGLGEGLMGNGSQGYASQIWGVTGAEYESPIPGAQSARRVPAGSQDRGSLRAGQRRAGAGGAGHQLRGMGPRRHGHVVESARRPRRQRGSAPAHARGARQSAGGLQDPTVWRSSHHPSHRCDGDDRQKA